MMRIHLEVFATLRDKLQDQLPGGKGTVETPDGTTINGLGKQLGIQLNNCAVMLDGELALDKDKVLEPDAKVSIIPPVAGG